MSPLQTFLGVVGILAAIACWAGPASSAAAPARWQPSLQSTPYPETAASADPAVIAEGKYLVEAVAHCPSCHVPRNQFVFADAKKMATLSLSGGEEWPMGPIGIIRSANITPDRTAGIGAWSDREIGRAIKSAVSRDGHSIFFMNGLGYFDDNDVRAIVSYLRTLPAVPQKAQPTQISPEGQKMMASQMQGWLQPRRLVPVRYVPRGERSAARGAYLANGPARCIQCHSDVADSPRVALRGAAFSGGTWASADRDDPSKELNAPNLTPSKYGVISTWSEAAFIARFRAGRVLESSDMPWEDFRLMTEEDLGSLYRYLKSLPAADHDPGPSYRNAGWKPGNQH